MCIDFRDDSEGYGYLLTSNGLEDVENWTEETYERIATDIIFPEVEDIPASDRVVTFDHNSEEYKETVSVLEQVSKEARESNEFGHLFADPEDRIRVSSEINSGLGLLKNLRVDVENIKNLLIANLKLIKEKLPDVALGALASKALEWLAKLLGL